MSHDTHNEKDSSMLKVAMNLAITCFIAGAIIAGTYSFTEPMAVQQRVKLKNDAMKELVKDADSFQAIEGRTDWYKAIKGGKVVAYVVPAESKGYGGAIKMLAAVTPDAKPIDYKILSHNETPGLGDKASEPKFRNQFAGKSVEDLVVVKTPTDNNIQALTGATITSRAVTKGIKEAVEAVAEYTAGLKE
ncbi:MAG: electron transport complex, RnfABCDGE type, subunit [Firmicutes bacterium]|nr:electron transport complex, RnfABCDGE type, subunit [Bacillota bacterium]